VVGFDIGCHEAIHYNILMTNSFSKTAFEVTKNIHDTVTV